MNWKERVAFSESFTKIIFGSDQREKEMDWLDINSDWVHIFFPQPLTEGCNNYSAQTEDEKILFDMMKECRGLLFNILKALRGWLFPV